MDDILKLNVGGGHFVTTRATLCAEEGSMFAKKFDAESPFGPPRELDGEIFIDREPETFRFVLQYLRNGCKPPAGIPKHMVKNLRDDADYFGLENLKRACDQEVSKATVGAKYDYSVFQSRSAKCCHLEKWLSEGYEIERDVVAGGQWTVILRKKRN